MIKNEKVSFRLDTETKEQLVAMAAADDITLSKLVYKIVRKFLEERGE